MRAPGGDCRGQSETLGFILLVAIATIGITSVVVLGSVAVEDSRHAMEVGSAEHAMTEFDSQVSLVAHGDSDSQVASLPEGRGQGVRTNPDAGRLRVAVHNQSNGSSLTLLNTSLGAVAYENGDTSIAYQGGGVWKGSADGVSSMVSPPEIHYQGTTLTLPLVLIGGEGSAAGDAQITKRGSSAVYPTATRENPLERGVVSLAVTSDYYEAWGRYFEQRMAGDVILDHPNDTARINLTVPFEGTFDDVVATTESGGVTIKGGGGGSGSSFDYSTGVNYPSADSRVASEVADCENGTCAAGATSITSAGTYYWDGDQSLSVDVDSPGGNVSLVVNGSLSVDDLTVTGLSGDQSVTAYVRDDFTVKKAANDVDGDSGEFQTLVHSDGHVELKGNADYAGLLYAPESSCEVRGSGSFEGAVVCESLSVRGNPSNTFTFGGEAVRTTDLTLSAGATRVTYLHVSTTTVAVTEA